MYISILLPILLLKISSCDQTAEPEYLNSLLESGNYKEFVKITRTADKVVRKVKDLTFLGYLKILDEEYGDVMLVEGQYYLTPESDKVHCNGVLLDIWQKFIPYAILPNNYTNENILKLEESIRIWNARFKGIIEFRHKKPEDKDYIAIFNGNACFSHFGKIGGVQAMSLDANFPLQPCLTVGWTHHEMMHSVGFMHANNRPDRNFYLRHIPENLIKEAVNVYLDIVPDPANPPPSDKNITKILGPFEYESIMFLQGNVKPGWPSFYDVLRSDVSRDDIGTPATLAMTALDEQKIRNFYNAA